jgi:nicotinate dehydrogenase subunit B
MSTPLADTAVTLLVNGREHQVTVRPTTPLMYVLRHDLKLKGVRAGCAIGECGACRVLLDGESVASCQTPVSAAVGAQVVTPEGLGGPDDPHPVQQAFLDEQAGQCGYCVNGMIVSVAARVARGPADADELRDVLDEHICRCGTHLRMLRAARRAAGLPLDARDERHTIITEPPTGDDGTDPSAVPAAVRAEPDIARWIELTPSGDVLAYPGKVELGQGLRTAFGQIVASQLGVDLHRVRLCPTRTGRSADQGQTSGSFSVEHGGTALAMAARALRRVLLRRAADQLITEPDELVLDERGAGPAGSQRRVSLAELAALGPITGRITPDDLPVWTAAGLGRPEHRDDLRRKLTGSPAFAQDIDLPGMLHARAVLPPPYDGAPVDFDVTGTRELRGVVELVRDGALVLVVADREDQAIRAQSHLLAQTRWRGGIVVEHADTEKLLRDLPAKDHVRRRDEDIEVVLDDAPRRHRATYVRPYQTHGPMSPSAAVAVVEDGRLRVWTHSQGIYPLRRELATFLRGDPEHIELEHVDGPGCYGLTCSDDAAALAAIAARAVPGRPVRFQFSVQDEFTWDPYGPGMVGDLDAAVDDTGAIAAWKYHVTSDTHSSRANGDGDRLLASWLVEGGVERPRIDVGEPSVRNALPLYDVGSVDVTLRSVRAPLRTGPLRSLGSFFNVFAAESFMDELAELAGADPVEYRLRHLRDQRAVRVLELAAERAGWQHHVGPSGRGLGVAFARYKDTKGYTAEVAEVEVDQEMGTFRVRRVVVACDAGTVINPDGLRNQLEGGVLQGLSRTLHEELHLTPDGVRERDWTTYGRLHFTDLPTVDVVLVNRPGDRPLGVGECGTPLVPAAVANALDDALGVRMRRLPLSPGNLRRRLAELDEREAERVLL